MFVKRKTGLAQNKTKVCEGDKKRGAVGAGMQGRRSLMHLREPPEAASRLRPVQTPSLDYYNMVREIRRVGYNMRQVARLVLNACDDLMMICLPRGKET